MSDCANVEMRELLPELASGTLDAATRTRVAAHVQSCAECASELDMLRLVRDAFAATPSIDTQRIVAALPKPLVSAPVRAGRRASVTRWVDWRVAAALTMITVGGLSVAVSQRFGNEGTKPSRVDTSVAVAPPESGRAVAVDTLAPLSGNASATSQQETARRAAARTGLSFNGGVGDLDDASIQALLGALDEIDRAPVAPSAEPDRSSVLPVIHGADR